MMLAQITNPALGPQGNPGATGGATFFQKFIPAAISIFLLVGVLVFFLYLVLGAIYWITSGGDKQKLENARNQITNALIGLVVLFAVFALTSVVQTFFHIQILNINFANFSLTTP